MMRMDFKEGRLRKLSISSDLGVARLNITTYSDKIAVVEKVRNRPSETSRAMGVNAVLLGRILFVITSYSIHYTKLYERLILTKCSIF